MNRCTEGLGKHTSVVSSFCICWQVILLPLPAFLQSLVNSTLGWNAGSATVTCYQVGDARLQMCTFISSCHMEHMK